MDLYASLESIPGEATVGTFQTEVEPESNQLVQTHDINVGDKIEVYCTLENKYFPRTVAAYDSVFNLHGISHDDGDSERHNMKQET